MPKAIPRKRGHLSKEHTEKESQQPGKTTTESALDYAMNIYITEGYRDRTMNDYAYFWEEFVRIVNKRYVNDYTSEDLRRYIKELLRNRGLSATTVNIRLASVRAVFIRLTKEKIITVNPAETIKKLRTDQNRIYTLTDNQLRRLFAVVNKETYAGYRDYCMMLTALKCGLRGIEIRQLEIDFVRRTAMPKSQFKRGMPCKPSFAASYIRRELFEARRFKTRNKKK
jgi:site-specific recombinase XerD